MEVIYALVPLLGGWLVYGLIASLFLKRASIRDYLKINPWFQSSLMKILHFM